MIPKNGFMAPTNLNWRMKDVKQWGIFSEKNNGGICQGTGSLARWMMHG